MDISFKNKVVWITGGSSGIGRAMVREFAGAGASVAWNYVNDPTGAEEQLEWLREHHHTTFARESDISQPGQVTDFVSDMIRAFGTVHVLVNNAGIRADSVSWKMNPTEWQRVLNVNLTGPFLCSHAVIPHMRKQHWGRIVFISSINGLRGKFGQANYAASKAGVIGLAKTLARETGAFGVTVNTVAPGMVMTPMTQTLQAEWINTATQEKALENLPEPEDIARTALFLCSEQARCITGQVLRVDSGQYI